MRVTPAFLAINLLLALSGSAIAAETIPARTLMEKSGLERQLQSLPDSMIAGLAEVQKQITLDDKFIEAWTGAVEKAYEPQGLVGAVEDGLEKTFPNQDREAVLRHYDSELGRRITEIEVSASLLEQAAEMESYVQALMQNPGAHSQRLALLQQLDEATGATKTAVTIAINTSFAVSMGLASLAPGGSVPTADEVLNEIEKRRFAITQQISSMVQKSFAFVYRDLSQDDLLAYIAYANSPSGKKFHLAMYQILIEMLKQRANVFGEELAKALSNRPT